VRILLSSDRCWAPSLNPEVGSSAESATLAFARELCISAAPAAAADGKHYQLAMAGQPFYHPRHEDNHN